MRCLGISNEYHMSLQRNKKKKYNILNIGTDRLEQTVDTDQAPQNVASDLGLHSLLLIQHYFRQISSSKILGQVW